jgi:hypothetical protein
MRAENFLVLGLAFVINMFVICVFAFVDTSEAVRVRSCFGATSTYGFLGFRAFKTLEQPGSKYL